MTIVQYTTKFEELFQDASTLKLVKSDGTRKFEMDSWVKSRNKLLLSSYPLIKKLLVKLW